MQTDLRELIAPVLEALPQAALVVTRRGEAVLRNTEADRLLPFGGNIQTILGGGTPQIEWGAELAALCDGTDAVVRRGVRLTAQAGRQLVVDVHLRSMGPCPTDSKAGADEPGVAWGRYVLVLVEDISGRVSMERRIAAGERLVAAGTLAAKVAHELNNPLDGVLRFIGLAERVARPEAGAYLMQAREGLMRMAEIIRGLLEQGRPWRAGGERIPLQRLLDEAVGSMQPRAQALGVAIVCDLDDRVDGAADGSAFQVFCNVIKNSLDALPNGGLLTITLRPAEEGCDIEFADTGSGLTEAEAERIFEPFYTTKPPTQGSGLGLTICREVVSRLGGSIAARSRAGAGLTVAVHLPLHPKWKPTQQETEP